MTRAVSTPALPVRFVMGVGTGIALGVALGSLAWLADRAPSPWSGVVPANTIGAWLGLAFLVGASARTVPTGALRGAIALLAADAAYYALTGALGGGFRAIGASHAAAVWGGVALVAGPVFGAAGGAWRHRRGWLRAIAVALLAAALVAEGLVFGGGTRTDPVGLLLLVEAGIGLVLPVVLLRPGERLRGYVATAAFAFGTMLAIGPVNALIRAAADRF